MAAEPARPGLLPPPPPPDQPVPGRGRGRGRDLIAVRVPANILWNGAAALDVQIPNPFPFSRQFAFGRLTLDPPMLRNTNFRPVAFDPDNNGNNVVDAATWDAIITNAQEVVHLGIVDLDDARDDGGDLDDGDGWETGYTIQIQWRRFGLCMLSLSLLAVGLALIPAAGSKGIRDYFRDDLRPLSFITSSNSTVLQTSWPFFRGSTPGPCSRPRQMASTLSLIDKSRFGDTCFLDQEVRPNATFVDALSIDIDTALFLSLDMVGNVTALYELSHLMYELPPVLKGTPVLKGDQEVERMVGLTLWDSMNPLIGWTAALSKSYAYSRRAMCNTFFLPLLSKQKQADYFDDINRAQIMYKSLWEEAYMYTWESERLHLVENWTSVIFSSDQGSENDTNSRQPTSTTTTTTTTKARPTTMTPLQSNEKAAAREVLLLCSDLDPENEDGFGTLTKLEYQHKYFLKDWKEAFKPYFDWYMMRLGGYEQVQELRTSYSDLMGELQERTNFVVDRTDVVVARPNPIADKTQKRVTAEALQDFAACIKTLLTLGPRDQWILPHKFQSDANELVRLLHSQLQRDKPMLRNMEIAEAGSLWQVRVKKVEQENFEAHSPFAAQRLHDQQKFFDSQKFEPWADTWVGTWTRVLHNRVKGLLQQAYHADIEELESKDRAKLVNSRATFQNMYSKLQLVAADTEKLVEAHFTPLADNLLQMQANVVPGLVASATALLQQDTSLQISHEEARELIANMAQAMTQLNDKVAGLVLAHLSWEKETSLRYAPFEKEDQRLKKALMQAAAEYGEEKKREEADTEQEA